MNLLIKDMTQIENFCFWSESKFYGHVQLRCQVMFIELVKIFLDCIFWPRCEKRNGGVTWLYGFHSRASKACKEVIMSMELMILTGGITVICIWYFLTKTGHK